MLEAKINIQGHGFKFQHPQAVPNKPLSKVNLKVNVILWHYLSCEIMHVSHMVPREVGISWKLNNPTKHTTCQTTNPSTKQPTETHNYV